MDKGEHRMDIIPNTIEDQHGLCDSAETHWAIYLIELINSKTKPTLHNGETVDGATLKYLMKGEDLNETGFTFGADSILVTASSDPALSHMLLVSEGDDVYSARPIVDLDTALQINGFYDPDLQSRWKEVVKQFATQKNLQPGSLNLPGLIAEATETA